MGRIVYWGAGSIGEMCLKLYTDIRPEFFIDSNKGIDSLCNIPVKRPNEVIRWHELFIVITLTTATDDIEKILESKKLIKGQNYVRCQDFFEIKRGTVEENIKLVKAYIEKNRKYENAVLIAANVFSGRYVNNLIHFFRQYGIRQQQNCVLFSNSSIINDIGPSDIVGYPTFNIPEVCTWKGNLNDGSSLDRNQLTHVNVLSEDERNWILELENRKVSEDKELSLSITSEMYWYYKNIFSVIKPSKIIIWGGWKRRDYILAELAKKAHIPYRFMEYGWVPGTFQLDRNGIAGQSEYAIDSDKICYLGNTVKTTDVKKIRDYIIANKTDTSRFWRIEEDEVNLQRIDRERKTVFLVGMDDDGMGINPKSDYWKKYVCSIFGSTQEAVLYIDEICRNNGWNFIFKPHPSSTFRNELSQEQLTDSVIQIKHMEIDRLIQTADVVVSISSAVEYKALIYGKPLVQLGHTTLSKKGCSYEVESIDEVEYQLQSALEKGMTKEQDVNFEQYMAWLLDNYLWDDLSDRELRYGLSLETDFFDEREQT